jgi:hypothetical protein
MQPRRFAIFVLKGAVFTVLALIIFRHFDRPLNPWASLGVTAEWQPYGTTRFTEVLYQVHFGGKIISGKANPGANYDFQLRAEDTERDGIPELIMENDGARLVLAFPAVGSEPPRFVTLFDNWPP